MMAEDWAISELQATCSNLGYNDGNAYHPDPDCVECVKDLIRFLRRDDNNHEIRRSLGDLGVVKSDLLPILRDHSNNRELFDVTLRLLVNLTNPELLLFKEELPEDKETRNYFLQIQNHRQIYKEAFIDQPLWTVLSKTLGALLKKDWDERLEDDKLIIERILILIRNVLQVPTNVRREGRTDGDATNHDQVLWVLHKSGMQDLLLYIASTDMEQQYCLHILEIISLMFREQDPMSLASANVGRSKAEKEADEVALAKALRLESQKEQAKINAKKVTRHSRFGGTYVVKNMKSISERDMIIQKPLANVSDVNFDKSKKGVKKAKNKVTPENLDIVRRSTLPVRLFLKEFCIEFLHSAYNHLMNIVKDALNRQKAQMNDETYYLWAMRFFMMFNRGHEMKLELVSETLSRQTFHFLQQQIDNYRDNFEHEKRNRPKYLMWGRRMHLCIRAYQELLYNLVDMEASANPDIKEAGRVLRASVFYEPEYRELCLQQLSSFNPDRMSRGYLTDLISTTHVFLKLMEHMSKNKHLIVSKKTKKRVKKSGAKKTGLAGGEEVDSRELNEQRWESISTDLSAVLQGRGQELPNEVMPFDAASDDSMDVQKVTAMKNIQRHLRNKEPAPAVALLRAAREIWPDGDSFGEQGAEPEDEFMALREVLFADLGVAEEAVPEAVETQTGEIGEEEEEEEEDEDEVKTYSVEQEFNFKAFVFRFAVKNVVMPYGVLFNNYLKNSKETNHHIIKMFHRIAVDCDLPAMLFQAGIFRVFQQIWKDLKTSPQDQSLRELAKFSKFILSKFLKVASENKKVFIELFFWKSSREATEIVEGYGTQTSSAKAKASFWSSEEEERLTTVFNQVREMESSGQNADRDGDILDQIELMFKCDNRSRRQIGNKLRELGLIQNMREITKKPLKSSRSWQEEEIEKLQSLFEEFKEAENPGARIYEQWKGSNMPVRSKNKLCDKIVELGWVDDRSKLGKVKKRNRRPKEGEAGFLDTKSDSDSALEDSSSEEEEESDEETEQQSTSSRHLSVREALEKLNGEESATLKWLSEKLTEESEDRKDDDFDGEDVSLVTLEEAVQTSMTKEPVIVLLTSLGLCAPVQGEQFWRVPGDFTVEKLTVRATLLEKVASGVEVASALEGIDMDLLTTSRGFDAMKFVKKKKKKEKRNKWLPFRKADTEAVPPDSPAHTKSQKKSKRGKNASFLDSSDDEEKVDEAADNEDIVESSEKTSSKEKKKEMENLKSSKTDVNPFDKIKPLDKDRLLKLLDSDDSFAGSDDDDEEETGKENASPKDQKKKSKPRKPAAKKPSAKGRKAKHKPDDDNTSDEEEPKKTSPPVKKKSSKKKAAIESSSDEGVDDHTQPSNERIRAESSDDDTVNVNTIAKKAGSSKKRVASIDSSSDEGVDDPTQPSVDRIKAATSEEDPDASFSSKHSRIRSNTIESSDDEQVNKQSGTRSPSVSSRSSFNDSRYSFDDSRAKSPTQWVYTPKKGSQNDSIMSRRSSLEDSRITRSPLSSPITSRSPSPSTPSQSITNSPLVKSTPAVKRLREESLSSAEKISKKSRILSPNQSLNLQLSDSDHQDGSPVKKVAKRKAMIESDSE